MYFNSKSLMPSNHIRMSAWLEHAPFAFWLMDVLKPRTVVELGTHNGFSFLSMCQAAKSAGLNTTIFAVDTWQGDEHAGFYATDVYDALEVELRTQYPGIGVLIRSTFNEARSQFADGSVDLLHIDGRHRYEDVVEDFENWKTVLSDRSVVLFHDTRVQHTDFGVWKFWKELESQYPTFEFYHGNGLGVLMWGKNAPRTLPKLNDTNLEEMQLTRETYARLGHLNSVLYQLDVANHHTQSALRECGLAASDIEKFHTNASELGRIIKDKYEAEKIAISEHWQNQQSGISQRYELKISELENNLEHNSFENAQILNELAAEREKNKAILTSKSWRMTKPYRYFGRQGRRAVHITKAMPSVVRRAGGLKSFSCKAYETLRDEGISGLKRRWIRANTPGNQVQVSVDGKIVDRNDYSEWVRLYSSIDGTSRKKIRKAIKGMAVKPKISIVMPVYNPNLNWLHEAINSVSSQLYDNWELCIADDCSSNPDVKGELEALQKRDERIRVVFRPQNGHISEASNSAIELATGEWLALMDQDDLLPEDALYYVAQTITAHPEARLIYSDEDKVDETGKRFDPYFKSDWNPDLFLSHNMICHLGVYHRETVQQLGGFREGYEGAQDYDLAMRMTEVLSANQIVHVPRVLYHWRSHAESTAQAGSNKNYALLAGQKTLDDHFQRTSIEAKTELLDFGMYRVHYAIPEDTPLVSLIIPTRNGLELTKQCIDSIVEKTTYPNYEIIIVDNNSDEPEALAYFEMLKKHDRIRVLRDERPFNYSALNNNAVAQANGEYVGLINNDIEVISPDWLSEMMSIALQPGVGAVGARLWYPNDTLQHGGVIIGLGGVAGHSHKGLRRDSLGYFGRAQLIQTLSAVTAACLVVSKDVYNAVGGLNEKELTVAFNDVDFCLKIRAAGYRNVWTPYAELYHHESATRGMETTPEKQQRFLGEIRYMEQTWATNYWNDPAYNPNLARDREDFSLAWPPRLRAL
ncbi:glycosyltransferase [Ochrobactrum sp. C6C9]|uniref:glycosyltransferase n=1 Tax=Ochrobactrum sp. C6C9 TaxID=2736662 RepID=UPI0035304259|nr:glycosyltransferase [Ochrobactrum sp. C6C9]